MVDRQVPILTHGKGFRAQIPKSQSIHLQTETLTAFSGHPFAWQSKAQPVAGVSADGAPVP